MKQPLVMIVGVEPCTFVQHQAFIEAHVTAERGWWMLESPHRWCDAVRDAAVKVFGSEAVTQVHRYRNLAQAFAHRVGLDVRSRATEGWHPAEWDAAFAEDVRSHGECFGCIASSAHSAWSALVGHIDPTPPVDITALPSPACTVESTPEALHRLLSPMMNRCKQMAICDPYLAASASCREQEAVAAIVVRIARQLGDRGPLALHVGRKAGTLGHVRGRLLDAAAKGSASNQGEINLTCWDDGRPGRKPHLRWICTDRGGLKLDYGIQDFVGDSRAIDVDRLSMEKSRLLINESEVAPNDKWNAAGWLYENGDVFTV